MGYPYFIFSIFVLFFSMIPIMMKLTLSDEQMKSFESSQNSNSLQISMAGAVCAEFPLLLLLLIFKFKTTKYNQLVEVVGLIMFHFALNVLIFWSFTSSSSSTICLSLIVGHASVIGCFLIPNIPVLSLPKYSYASAISATSILLLFTHYFSQDSAVWFPLLMIGVLSMICTSSFLGYRMIKALRKTTVTDNSNTLIEIPYIILMLMVTICLWITCIYEVNSKRQSIFPMLIYKIIEMIVVMILFISKISRQYSEAIYFNTDIKFQRMLIRYISHEICTPLNVVHLGLKLLQKELLETDLSSPHLRTVEEIMVSCDATLTILNDLLIYEGIESGNLQMKCKNVDIVPFIKESIQVFSIQARQTGVQLILEITPSLSSISETHTLFIDRRKMFQVMRNLLSNALKFSDEGGTVVVRLSCYQMSDLEASPEEIEEASSPMVLRIEVKDDGCGISEENLPRVFKERIQFDLTELRENEGAGLGLWISRGIVECHGGTITVSSAGEGQGSTFCVDLPIQLPSLQLNAGAYAMNTLDRLNQPSPSTDSDPLPACQSIEQLSESSEQERSRVLSDTPESDFHHKRIIKGLNSGNLNCDSESTEAYAGHSRKGSLKSSIANNKSNSHIEREGNPATRNIRRKSKSISVRQSQISPDVIDDKKMRFLFVDDVKMSRKMVKRMLLTRVDTIDANCDEAVDGFDAVAKVRHSLEMNWAYDAILMDHMMPNMDGPTAAKEMRAMGYKGPIIGITGNTSKEDIQLFLHSGANKVLGKPLDINALEAALRESLAAGSSTVPSSSSRETSPGSMGITAAALYVLGRKNGSPGQLRDASPSTGRQAARGPIDRMNSSSLFSDFLLRLGKRNSRVTQDLVPIQKKEDPESSSRRRSWDVPVIVNQTSQEDGTSRRHTWNPNLVSVDASGTPKPIEIQPSESSLLGYHLEHIPSRSSLLKESTELSNNALTQQHQQHQDVRYDELNKEIPSLQEPTEEAADHLKHIIEKSGSMERGGLIVTSLSSTSITSNISTHLQHHQSSESKQTTPHHRGITTMATSSSSPHDQPHATTMTTASSNSVTPHSSITSPRHSYKYQGATVPRHDVTPTHTSTGGFASPRPSAPTPLTSSRGDSESPRAHSLKRGEHIDLPLLSPIPDIRILIVSSNDSKRTNHVRNFRNKWNFCEEAKDGVEAMSLVRQYTRMSQPFHAIIVDYELLGIDGPTTMDELRAMGFAGKFVGVVPFAHKEQEQIFKQHGVSKVVYEPIDLIELVAYLEHECFEVTPQKHGNMSDSLSQSWKLLQEPPDGFQQRAGGTSSDNDVVHIMISQRISSRFSPTFARKASTIYSSDSDDETIDNGEIGGKQSRRLSLSTSVDGIISQLSPLSLSRRNSSSSKLLVVPSLHLDDISDVDDKDDYSIDIKKSVVTSRRKMSEFPVLTGRTPRR